MHNPLITIITPSYNQGQFIRETIESVIAQSYKNIQYIVVDGGSNDNTMDVVKEYSEKIDIIISEKDSGQSDAINKGFRLAKGDLVGWINSDDTLSSNCIQEIVDLYKENEQGAIFSGSKINVIDIDSQVVGQICRKISSFEELVYKNYDVIQPGSFYRRKTLLDCGFLDQKLKFCMDLDLFIRLLMNGKIYYSEVTPLANFRIWEQSKTSSSTFDFTIDIMKTLRKYGANYYSFSMLRLYALYLRSLVSRALKIMKLKR